MLAFIEIEVSIRAIVEIPSKRRIVIIQKNTKHTYEYVWISEVPKEIKMENHVRIRMSQKNRFLFFFQS